MPYDDGLSTTITFASGAVSLKMVGITPPPVQGGGSKEMTNLDNTAWRTFLPKILKTLGSLSLSVQYDETAYTDVVAQVNVNQAITVTFPNGATLVFWGWIDEFTPGESVEGEDPVGSVTVIPSNVDGANAEIAPAFTPAV